MKNLVAAGLLSLALTAAGAAQTSNAAQEKAEKNVHITEGPSVVQVTGTSAVLSGRPITSAPTTSSTAPPRAAHGRRAGSKKAPSNTGSR